MKCELFPFQKKALISIRREIASSINNYRRQHVPQVVSYTAPTGAGKTIIMASLIEAIYGGDEYYPDQPDAIFVWLSDSPQLNEQSRLKIDSKADRIRLNQCVTVSDDSFDRETFEDGHIYFLNTQKLSKSSNLTKHSDGRQYTIWETIANTARDKSDRFYFIIDEAHRGAQKSTDLAKATTIMQKFLKGSDNEKLPPMPVVIGMTATPQRFNRLAEGIQTTTVHHIRTTADEVRASGLLKDRIVITYPDMPGNDMAVLQAAADEWKNKCDHWYQYCFEQHYAFVNPIFVIQVQNGTSSRISSTDLDECVRIIEERTGERFVNGQVVHAFGEGTATISINGLTVPYVEPSRIADDRKIKVVFFKETLSTGWDCPRAETMMSFRHANDYTYIAQLLGRMVRTPLQMHINVDETLNDVHLYLPQFNGSTVYEVVEALQSAEGANIPTDVEAEIMGNEAYDVLTLKPTYEDNPRSPVHKQVVYDDPKQPSLFDDSQEETSQPVTAPVSLNEMVSKEELSPTENVPSLTSDISETDPVPETKTLAESSFDREAVVKAINDSGLLSYNVRKVRISDYLKSVFALARFLSMTRLSFDATDTVIDEIVEMIHSYVDGLKQKGEYKELAEKVMEFKLSTQVFDLFGMSVDNFAVHDLFSTTDTDIDRQFRLADTKLGNEGVGNAYGKKYIDYDDPVAYKIDVILFVADAVSMSMLDDFARNRFHELNDSYRRKTSTLPEKYKKKYDDIVSDGDVVSKHNFRLPETIQIPHENDGKLYSNHLFVDNSGTALIKLNGWEEKVIEEEETQEDFVCWLRNPPRGTWALCIPYELDGERKPTYPDFLIIRQEGSDYIVDILEPHDSTRNDNLGKAKGFAEYARQNPGVGRIQLIRMKKDSLDKERPYRLDMSKSSVRDKVSRCTSNAELNHIFDEDGFFI